MLSNYSMIKIQLMCCVVKWNAERRTYDTYAVERTHKKRVVPHMMLYDTYLQCGLSNNLIFGG